MRRPSMQFLPREWGLVVGPIAERLQRAGRRAWVVGGAVRDLALGITPDDVDMASDAPPEEIERLFERTFAVGRAFGTVVVQGSAGDVQVTTFRTERGYSDRRRPDEVRWGASVEEDAARRDFTCNALYLDPLSDELCDPTGGLADLENGLLRCVGDALERFREDGLRLVRLARFAAALDLRVEPATFTAARSARDSLSGVSPERVAEELRRIFFSPRAARALGLMDELGLLDVLFPSLGLLPGRREVRLGVLAAFEPSAGFEEGLAILLDPAPGGAPAAAPANEVASGLLDGLRLAREERRAVEDLWRLQAAARQVLAEDHPPRSRRVRLVREPRWPRAARILGAWQEALGGSSSQLGELERFAAGLGEAELRPEPLVTAADLAEAGIPRGPRWGRILEQAEDLQLEGLHVSRQQALEWLAQQAAVQ